MVNNSAPVLDLDANNSSGSFQSTFRNAFTENGAPVPIADVDTTITDADSTTLLSATITLANRQTGDLLTVSGALPGNDHHGWLRSRYRRAHAHRYGHAG